MKTIDLYTDVTNGVKVTLELNEFELTMLVALVEQGQQQLSSAGFTSALHTSMDAVANEFCSLLGLLELQPASE